MDALSWVPLLRPAHLALVVTSGALFAVRGAGALAGARWPQRPVLRVASVVIDTFLLMAGVALWAVLQLNPLRDHWMATKLALLLLYIVLGSWALKRARSKVARAIFLCAALTVFATLLSIGWMRHPLGFWRWI